MSNFQKRHPRPASAQMPNRPTNALHKVADGINTVVGAPARVMDKVNLGFAQATNVIANALPKFPAATFGNMALGLPHAHILHPPSGPFPIPPIPLPPLGPIMLGNCVQVLINGKPAARAGDIGIGPTCCGLPPFYEIFTGSSNVFIGGSRAARVTDVTMHCTFLPAGGAQRAAKAAQAASKMAKMAQIAKTVFAVAQTGIMVGGFAAQGLSAMGDAIESVEADNSAMADALALSAAMGAAQLANDAAAMAASLLMGKDLCVLPVNPGMILDGSPNVLIGGFPMPSWMDIAKGLLKLVKGLRNRRNRRNGNRPSEGDNGRPARDRNDTCTNGCPISMVNGEELLGLTDFDIDGPLPFRWQRTYRTSHNRDLSLGHGWTYPGCERMRIDEHDIVYFNEEGRNIFFPKLVSVGDSAFHASEKTELIWESEKRLRLKRRGTHDKIFELSDQSGYWLVSEYVDPHHNRITFERDDQDRLAHVSNNMGRGFRVMYDDAGRMEHLVPEGDAYEDMAPAFVTYGYSPEGDLVEVRNRLDRGERYGYRNHVITERVLASGFRFQFEWDRYDIYGRCLRNWGDDGFYDYRFAWYPEENRSESTDGRGVRVSYNYNDFGQLTRHTDGNGHTSYFFYNENGDLREKVGPGIQREVYEYDSRGNCTQFTNAGGQVFRMSYDGEDRPVDFTDPGGNTWTRTYNDRGSVEEIVDPSGNATRFEVNAQGLPTQMTMAGGGSVTLGWNPRGDLIWKKESSGRKVAYRHDADGNVTHVIRPDGAQLVYEYNGLGQPVSLIDGGKQRHRFSYGPLGAMTAYTDPGGKTTRQIFNRLGLLTSMVLPGGATRGFTYDAETNLTAVVNEKGEKTSFTFDGEGRILRQTGFDGSVQEFIRDAHGFVTEHRFGEQRWVRYVRDPMGRVLKKIGTVRSGRQVQEATYGYDPAGRMVRATNGHQSLTFDYDALGNLICERSDDGELRHEYDTTGKRTATVFPSGDRLDQRHGEDGLSAGMDWNGQGLVDFVRDGLGRVNGHRLANGLEVGLAFDPMDRLKNYQVRRQDHPERSGDPLVLDRYYQYDHSGKLSQVQDSRHGLSLFRYDPHGKLESVEGFLGELFHYDPAGNLMGSGQAPPETEATGNRLAGFEGFRFAYDACGNLVERAATDHSVTFEYNGFNHLTRSIRDGRETHYHYDALGRRIAKVSEDRSVRFVWDGDLMVQETVEGASPTTYLYEPGSFRPLARAVAGEIQYYHNDHRGLPREMTGPEGTIIWSGSHGVYGALRDEDVTEASQPLRLPGQYFDEETGLHYNRHRYYDPECGRYTQPDPIGLRGGMNPYQYTEDPVREIDPLGLASLPCRNLNASTWADFRAKTKGWFTKAMSLANPSHPIKDAAAGWRVYQDTRNRPEMPVMGRLPDVGAHMAAHPAGYQHLNSNPWTIRVNDAWIMGGVDDGKTFRVVSNLHDPETRVRRDRTTGAIVGDSVTHRELTMLDNFGYTFHPDRSDPTGGTGWLVPPGGTPPAGAGPATATPNPPRPTS
ncbi:PAAR domain-containing protein [Sulfidibacter corallicola]|uniref:PAAR domain-containing protein n=1 Tax=Sulfidibacter corallicola TaxID=2818388 RepID=A0A8A4TIW4_SULCO|nr:RHS repeat-associated core domain-containing protein [Sulfidibacter corallicola]QTD49490.1 PAAR domain-containing protein [Sulfidibacter corallicola]